MKELGAYLKQTRISKGVNIAEAAEDLELSIPELENIESGNIKAFKDLYDLKNFVNVYAKYLGLNPDKVADQFNGFLFDYTSKISLEDIKVAQKSSSDANDKKIRSPYTIEFKPRSKVLPIVMMILIFIATLFITIYIIVSSGNEVPARVDELSPVITRGELL